MEWISVDERLPDCYTAVLVFDSRMNKMFTAYLSDDQRRFRGNKVWIIRGAGMICLPLVTHWMPLPAPPSE